MDQERKEKKPGRPRKPAGVKQRPSGERRGAEDRPARPATGEGRPARTERSAGARKPAAEGRRAFGDKPAQERGKAGFSDQDKPHSRDGSQKRWGKSSGRPGGKSFGKAAGERTGWQGRGPGFGVHLVFEDDTIIVVDKPAGLLSVATDKEGERTVFRALREYLNKQKSGRGELSAQKNRRRWGAAGFEEAENKRDAGTEDVYIGVVHRLDRETSGIMVFVKTEEARKTMTSDWQGQVHDRRYLAVLEGKPLGGVEGTVHNWLKQNKAFRVYSLDHADQGAEEAITHWKVLRDASKGQGANAVYERTLVELRLETGRTNQIRVHMADLDAPVAGDRKYGHPPMAGGTAGKWPSRLALHAKRIEFTHPVSGEKLSFESPVPPEMKALMR